MHELLKKMTDFTISRKNSGSLANLRPGTKKRTRKAFDHEMQFSTKLEQSANRKNNCQKKWDSFSIKPIGKIVKSIENNDESDFTVHVFETMA